MGATARSKVLFVGGCRASFHQLEPAEPLIQHVLEGLGLEVDITGIRHPYRDDRTAGDYGALSADTLGDYVAVVLFTTGRGEGEDTGALLDFVRRGGALVGIHCAADSFTSDAAYIDALGGKFRTHPAPLDIAVEFVDADHPVTRGLAPFMVHDELYLFSDYDPSRVHLLAQTRSYSGEGPDPIPVCWVRDEGDGRVFYLSLGHFPEVMASPDWQALFAQGVRWALLQL